jgi:hypothetical protein
MKKGKIYTCNGCYAFEESVRCCPIGSPAGSYLTEPFCGIGVEIEKIKYKYGYRPVCGTCEKPKTIADLVRVKKIFYDSTMIKN